MNLLQRTVYLASMQIVAQQETTGSVNKVHVETPINCCWKTTESVRRAIRINKRVVANWFNMYKKTLKVLRIEDCSAHIWITDETGFQDHLVSNRVISKK
jgi:hypothetical protein